MDQAPPVDARGACRVSLIARRNHGVASVTHGRDQVGRKPRESSVRGAPPDGLPSGGRRRSSGASAREVDKTVHVISPEGHGRSAAHAAPSIRGGSYRRTEFDSREATAYTRRHSVGCHGGDQVPTSFLSSPGLSLSAADLRELRDVLGSIAVDVERDALQQLDLDDATVDLSVVIELPTELAGPAGKALRSVDLAWRLAYVLTVYSPSELPSSGIARLDELAPVEETGLRIEFLDIGSVRAALKAGSATIRGGVTTIQVVAALASVSGYTARDVVHSQSANAAGTPCRVEFVGEHPESLSRMIREELPGLPPGCTVTIEGKALNGAHFRAQIQVPGP